MHAKPMLGVKDLIAHLQDKGVQFSIMSEFDANAYLCNNNNFFKLTSYRKNYSKYTDGKNAGKYEHLDFAYLIELARIDVEVRHILLKMCLDIEHFLKVYLISFVENRVLSGTDEDGYKIVLDYISDANQASIVDRASNIQRRSAKVAGKLRQNLNNPYCGDLITKYQSDMPIWALVEIISFGDLLDIIDYCVDHYSMPLPIDRACLDRVRQIRNATAHNNCIINDLRPCQNGPKTPQFITAFVGSAGIGKNMREKKLSNSRINQIVHLFYAYNKIVTSTNTRTNRINELRELLDTRIVEHSDYFVKNDLLTSTYDFFLKLSKVF